MTTDDTPGGEGGRCPDCKRPAKGEAGAVCIIRGGDRCIRTERDNLRAEVSQLDARRREGRGLLRRMVKYATEDRATTAGTTRLQRLTEQVADYLNRTHEPRDILR